MKNWTLQKCRISLYENTLIAWKRKPQSWIFSTCMTKYLIRIYDKILQVSKKQNKTKQKTQHNLVKILNIHCSAENQIAKVFK